MAQNYLLFMAKYHAWAYESLFEKIKDMPDDIYFADAGLVFRSIHGTLCHLYAGDQFWMTLLMNEEVDEEIKNKNQSHWMREDIYAKPGDAQSHWEEIIPDRKELEKALIQQSKKFKDFLEANPQYTKIGADNTPAFTLQIGFYPGDLENHLAFLHVFNHRTHHVGQITAAASRLWKPLDHLDLLDYMFVDMKNSE
ncbi:uncharacterized protein VTP21DRAFT_10564 [Calcarisporiella thermophila]|uniref:uncharacterized protein n=1 Tax=Calcarisporiella thermophila TaxID=911321 RepID=UPI0037429B01